METWVRKIANSEVEDVGRTLTAALNHYANGFAEWCVENVPKRDLPLAIAAMERALGMMKEMELNDDERNVLEVAQKMTAVVAVKRGKERE